MVTLGCPLIIHITYQHLIIFSCTGQIVKNNFEDLLERVFRLEKL